MSKAHRDEKLYISDILESIRKIEAYTRSISFEEFSEDDKTKDAVLRNLEVVGEAVKNISDGVKARYPDIDWKVIAGMRNKLIHEYFGVSFSIVWETVRNDIPPFKLRVERILKDMG